MESLSSLMMITDVERPSLPQSASRGVLRIVPDNPVNFLQAVWMPCPPPVLTGTHWSLLRSFLFSSFIIILVAGLHLVCW